jgi:hypothetical protein
MVRRVTLIRGGDRWVGSVGKKKKITGREKGNTLRKKLPVSFFQSQIPQQIP